MDIVERSLRALYLELPEAVADGHAAIVRAELTTLRAEVAELKADKEKLQGVLYWGCEQIWEGWDIDGGDFQDKMEAAGLLVEVPADERIRGEFDTDVMFVPSWSPLADAARAGEEKG